MQRKRIVASLVVLFLLASISAFGAGAGDKVKGKGVITFRSGDTLTVKTPDGPVTVVLTNDTKVQQPIGMGVRKKEMPADVLIPGLRLSFEGMGDQKQVTAKTITFDSDDLALAEVIQAGLNPTAMQTAANVQSIARGKAAIVANRQEIEANQQRIAANQQQIVFVAQETKKRFSELTDWEVKTEGNVLFAVGSYALSEDYKQALSAFAQEALKLKGYVIEVKGFADSRGSMADNQILSKQRAEAVVAYLLQECGVPVKNIVAPGAMSETNPSASNESATGRAENRRVTLRILQSKGIAGS